MEAATFSTSTRKTRALPQVWLSTMVDFEPLYVPDDVLRELQTAIFLLYLLLLPLLLLLLPDFKLRDSSLLLFHMLFLPSATIPA